MRLLGRDYQPLAGGAVTLTVKRGADPQRAETGRDRADHRRRRRHRGPRARRPGARRVPRRSAARPIGGRQVDATDIFLVREGGTELDRPVGDPATLEAIARATAGVALGPVDNLPASLAFDPPRIVRVDRRTDVELWSRPGLFVLVIGLLGLEWLLRQRSGYL